MYTNPRCEVWTDAKVYSNPQTREEEAKAIVPDAPMTERIVQNVDAHLGAVR